MFINEYREAYDKVLPEENSIEHIFEHMQEEQKKVSAVRMLRPVLMCTLMFSLGVFFVTPVMAKNIPAVYSVLEEHAPSLLDYILPEEHVSTKAGITMQVEAVSIVENNAEMVVSFRDEDGFDYINGPVDMYDSYNLACYGGDSNVGGCYFLTYDSEADKAYFKLSLTSLEGEFGGTCEFRVSQLLTEKSVTQQDIDVSNILYAPKLKAIYASGGSGVKREVTNKQFGEEGIFDPRPAYRVMDLGTPSENLIENLKVTGIGYSDGVLSVQFCRGNFSEADRHVDIRLLDGEGNDRIPDGSVGWQEEVAGEPLLFEEQYFLVEEEELEQCKLYGIFYITEGCINGGWKVTFRMSGEVQ